MSWIACNSSSPSRSRLPTYSPWMRASPASSPAPAAAVAAIATQAPIVAQRTERSQNRVDGRSSAAMEDSCCVETRAFEPLSDALEPFADHGERLGDLDALLMRGVALADLDGAVFHRVAVHRKAVRRADLVMPRVPFADRVLLVVLGVDALAEELLD